MVKFNDIEIEIIREQIRNYRIEIQCCLGKYPKVNFFKNKLKIAESILVKIENYREAIKND